MTLGDAEKLANTMTTKDDALRVAIEMLEHIQHGSNYGTFEYITKVERMKKLAAGEERTQAGNTPVCDCCGLQHNTDLDCTEVSLDEKKAVFHRAHDAQVAFWHAMGELEAVVGGDVDGTRDLGDIDVTDLIDDEDGDRFFQLGQPETCAFCKTMGHACIDHESK